MIKKIITGLLGLSAVLISDDAHSQTRGRVSYRTSVPTINVQGTTTLINATVTDTTSTTTDYTQIAPPTDAIAKQKCTKIVVDAISDYCNDNKCKNATEVYAMITLPTTTVGPNATYCANFIEEAVNKLWNSYDSYAANDEKNCNIALARSLAAEACYRFVLTNQNEKVIIDSSTLNPYCGIEAVKSQYELISNKDKISDSEAGDNLTKYFSKVGNIGWSNLASYTRLLDGKADFKTTEFPRDLIQLVNSLKSQGNMMCGEKNYTELYDANIELVDKAGSMERKISEDGIFKGGADWIYDQVGVFKGEDWQKEQQKKGLFGKTNTSKSEDKKTTIETETPETNNSEETTIETEAPETNNSEETTIETEETETNE